MRVNQKSKIKNQKSAFTLVELLIVIGIIVLLIGLLIPVVSRVKTSAQEADTKALIQSLDGAIQAYYNTYRAYPGPIPNNLIANANATSTDFQPFSNFVYGVQADNPGFDVGQSATSTLHTKITGAENLVLGLCGGLRVDTSGAQPVLKYEPAQVGQGPASLNPGNPKRAAAFIDTKNLSFRTENNLKTGHFQDESGEANDSPIPEFVDKFTVGPMPVLYLRARSGAKANTVSPATIDLDNNGVINEYGAAANRYLTAQQYDLAQIIGYTGAYTGSYPSLALAASGSAGRSIGQGKSARQADYTAAGDYLKHGLNNVAFPFKSMDKSAGTTYQFPYDAYPYFADPNASNTARQKDGYILISAGRDRVYGTNDDITNFGPVK